MNKDIITATMLLLAVVIAVAVPRLSTPIPNDDVKQRLDVICEATAESVELLKQTNATLHEIARQHGDRFATLTSED